MARDASLPSQPTTIPRTLRDAPEHYEHARAMGTLTWGTWDHAFARLSNGDRISLPLFRPPTPCGSRRAAA